MGMRQRRGKKRGKGRRERGERGEIDQRREEGKGLRGGDKSTVLKKR